LIHLRFWIHILVLLAGLKLVGVELPCREQVWIIPLLPCWCSGVFVHPGILASVIHTVQSEKMEIADSNSDSQILCYEWKTRSLFVGPGSLLRVTCGKPGNVGSLNCHFKPSPNCLIGWEEPLTFFNTSISTALLPVGVIYHEKSRNHASVSSQQQQSQESISSTFVMRCTQSQGLAGARSPRSSGRGASLCARQSL
jgi:hypothetical protein